MAGKLWWSGAATIALMAAVAACGDTFAGFEGEDGGGGSGASGGSGSGAGGSGGAGPCNPGGECFVEGAYCTDGACCPCSYQCSGGVWQQEACAGCAEQGCPFEIPQEGSNCDYCGQTDCDYQSCGDLGLVHTSCQDGTWKLETTACEEPPPCGPDPTSPSCAPGEVCLVASYTAGPQTDVTYSCKPNPCAPYPADCSCAQQLCNDAGAPLCISAEAQEIHCDNGAD